MSVVVNVRVSLMSVMSHSHPYLKGQANENKMARTRTRGQRTVCMRKYTFHYNEYRSMC